MMSGTLRNVAVETGGRSGARRFLATVALVLSGFTVPAVSALAQDGPAVTVNEEGGVYSVAATFTVPQPPAFARAALTDYAGIPRFMPEVRTSKVIERADDGAVVEQEAVARFLMFSRRIHLVLEVQEAPGTIRFRDRHGESFELYEGLWTISERDGTTVVTYELSAKPSFDVPEFLLKRLLKRDASEMIERLKTEIDARARREAH
jgi:ribosome-associated toxin RatA of RatAB toxin-antitoxin module